MKAATLRQWEQMVRQSEVHENQGYYGMLYRPPLLRLAAQLRAAAEAAEQEEAERKEVEVV